MFPYSLRLVLIARDLKSCWQLVLYIAVAEVAQILANVQKSPAAVDRASFQTKLENIRLDTAKGYSEGPSLNLRNPSGSSGCFSITSSQVGSNAKFPMLEKSLF